MPRRPRPSAHDLAAEIIRRATDEGGHPRYVIRLSELRTPGERLQLIAARRERRPIVILPHKCKTMEEWLARYRTAV